MTRQPAIIESHLQPLDQTEKQPWERMENEPRFWYNRFVRFRGLGPKRTMLAALEQERASRKVPKSTQTGKKPKPKSKSVAVPGSWKQASIQWNWVARSQAYDEEKVEKMVATMFEDLYSGPALAFNRVMALRNILDSMTKDFNRNNAYLSPDQRLGYYARMQKILQAIADEMKVFDNPTQALLMRHFAAKEYADYKSPLTPEGYLKLVEKAGGQAALKQQIEEEDARRKERKALEQMIDSAFAEEH